MLVVQWCSGVSSWTAGIDARGADDWDCRHGPGCARKRDRMVDSSTGVKHTSGSRDRRDVLARSAQIGRRADRTSIYHMAGAVEAICGLDLGNGAIAVKVTQRVWRLVVFWCYTW